MEEILALVYTNAFGGTYFHSGWNDKYIGKQVCVTGTLYHAISGHNHTEVLIMAEHFEFARITSKC